MTGFKVILVLIAFWIIPAIVINIMGAIICFYENKPPIYVKDVRKTINRLDYYNVRWVPIFNILFVISIISECIDDLEIMNKFKNKIYKIKNKVKKRIENIKLK